MITSNMKGQMEADPNNNNKKPLWRQKYKEVKVSSLLHSNSVHFQHCPEVQENIQHRSTVSKKSQHSYFGQQLYKSTCEINGFRYSRKTENSLIKNEIDSHLQCNGNDNGAVNDAKHNEYPENLFESSATWLEREVTEQFNKSHDPRSEFIQTEKGQLKITTKNQENTSNLLQKDLFTSLRPKANKQKDVSYNPAGNGDLVVSESSHRVELKSKPRARKARIERRHTIIGASSIVETKDNKDWISVSDDKLKKGHKFSKDDSEVFIAKTGIVRTKLAENKTSQNWNKNREKSEPSSSTNKETNFAMHRRVQEKERNGSCSDFSSISQQEAFQRQEQKVDRGSGNGICSISKIRNEDSCLNAAKEPDKNILTTGINNKLNCFLTPRQFKTDKERKKNIMQQSRSWNGNSFDGSSVQKSSTPQHNGNGIRHNDTTELVFIEDDDDFLLGNRMRNSSKGGDSKYNTFLDLSNLNLDEDVDPSSDGSLESVVTSLSDPESGTEREEERESDDFRSQNEDVNGIVSFILCRSLDKIDEEPKEEEACMQEDESTSVLFEKNSFAIRDEDSKLDEKNEIIMEEPNDVKTDDEHRRESSKESCVCCHNNIPEETVELREKVAFEGLSINDSAATQSDQTNCTETTSSLSTDSAASGLSDGSETTPSLESDKFQSCTCDSTDEEEFNLANENISKNLSSETKTMFNGGRLMSARSKRMSMPGDVRKLLKSQNIDSDQSNLSPTEKSALRSGLKRLFQIAMSAVDGNNRPGPKIKDILNFIETKGIKLSGPRMRGTIKRIEKEPDGAETSLNLELFCRVCEPSFNFIRSIFLSQLTIPGFNVFKLRMSRIFENLQEILNNQGDVTPIGNSYSSYNAAMRKLRQRKSQVSLSVCTVDGQRCSFGNAETPHPLNACAAVFNYCLACQQNGIEACSHFMGRRQHDEDMNEFLLLPSEKICNPFSKAGAFVTSSLLFREMEVENRLNLLHEFYRSLIGQELLCCDNLSYNYKRIYSHDEIGLAYFLSATQRLPKGTSSDLANVLDFHFQGASSAVTSDACAIGAATLANGGVCCLTDEVVVNAACVQHTLDVMRSCRPSLSRESGKEAEDIAAAWNDHGSIMLIIPGVLAITCFVHCQSKDVIQKMVESLTKDLLSTFNFSVYKSLKDRRNAFFQRPSLP